MLHTLLTKIGMTIIGAGMLVAGWLGVQTPSLGSTVPITPAIFETSLASPIGISDTAMTLAAGTLIDGSTLTGYACFTLDSGQPNLEYVCGTASGTAVTAMTRGINPLNGTSSVAALKFTHRRGADVKITDYPALSIMGRIMNGLDGFPGVIHYDSGVATTSIILNDQNIVSYGLLRTTALSGGTPATVGNLGLTKMSVAPVSAANPISVGDNDTRVSPVSLASVTAGQVSALAGSSSTPSSTNKYLTQAGVATTSTANAIVQASSTGKIDSSFVDLSTAASSSLIGSFPLIGGTITSTTTLGTFTVAANAISRLGVLKITLPLTGTTNTAGSIIFSVGFGGSTSTLVLTCPAVGGGASIPSAGDIYGYIRNNASTTQQRVTLGSRIGAGFAQAAYASIQGAITQATTTIDTTSSQTLSITLSSTGCSNVQAYDGIVELIK